MDETELENLIVRITGDASSYESMLEDAQEKSEKAADNVEKAAGRIEKITEATKGFAKSAIEIVTGLGAKGMLEDFLDSFAEAEDVDISLSAALKANGREVEKLMEQYQNFATEIEHQTTLSDEAVKILLKQAETFGLTGKAAEKAAKNAVSLAEVTGTSAQAMIRLTAALQKGDIDTARRFGRLVPQLRGIKDNEEFVKKATDLMNQGWETSTEKAGTAHGMLKQIDEILGDLKEELGKVVSDVIKPFIAGLKDIATWLGGIPAQAKQAIVVALGLTVAIGTVTAAITAAMAAATLFDISTGGMLLVLGLIITTIALATGAIISFAGASGGMAAASEQVVASLKEFWQWLKPVRQALVSLGQAIEEVFNQAVESFKEAIVEMWQSLSEGADWNEIRDDAVRAIISIEFYLRNFKRTWDIVWFGAKLAAFSLREDIIHLFTVQLPIVVGHFGDVVTATFTDMIANFKTANINLLSNIANTAKLIPSIIAGRITVEQAMTLWKPLTDGFQHTVKAFPEIPKRIVGPVEKAMESLFGQMWKNLDDDRKKFIEQKLAEFGLTPEAEKEAEEAGEDTGEQYDKGLKKELDKVDAAIFGSAEALGRIADYRERNARRAMEDTSPQKKEPGFGQRMFDTLSRQKAAEEIKTKDPEALEILKMIAKNTSQIPKIDFEGFLIPSNLG